MSRVVEHPLLLKGSHQFYVLGPVNRLWARPKAFSAGPEGPWGHCPPEAYYDGPGQGFTSVNQGARQRTRTCNRFSGPKNLLQVVSLW